MQTNEVLIQEGEDGTEITWPVQETHEVYKRSRFYEKIHLGEIHDKEIIGKMSFLTNSVRTATARTMEPFIVPKIPKTKSVNVINQKSNWFRALVNTLAFRLHEADKKVT